LVRWGESSLRWHTHTVCGAVEDLEPLLVSKDPRAVKRLWQVTARALYFRGGVVVTSAISGID
jgi:galactonate dehydratase